MDGMAEESRSGGAELEWCDRRLLARIHRLTLTGLRNQIRPVQPREDLPWLVAGGEVVGDRALPVDQVRGHSERVWNQLVARGALFFQELKALTELLPSHLDEALRELAAWGLITCDGFGAVRAWVGEAGMRSRERNSFPSGFAMPAGRWTCFLSESAAGPMNDELRMERWCRLLLRRYGVIFRDLLTREVCAPSWQELVRTLRRMELRGDVRGGRFVADVAGEQFADEQGGGAAARGP